MTSTLDTHVVRTTFSKAVQPRTSREMYGVVHVVCSRCAKRPKNTQTAVIAAHAQVTWLHRDF